MARLTRDQYQERLRGLRLLATDVDGVLTDGSITYTEAATETKTFHVRDGSAIYIARVIGLPVLVVTARESAAVARRFAELPVFGLRQATFDKISACAEAEAELGIDSAATVFLGDDLVDLPAMRRAGLGVAVADANRRVLAEADWVLVTPGGKGALRELMDDIVDARDLAEDVLADYQDRAGKRAVAQEKEPGVG